MNLTELEKEIEDRVNQAMDLPSSEVLVYTMDGSQGPNQIEVAVTNHFQNNRGTIMVVLTPSPLVLGCVVKTIGQIQYLTGRKFEFTTSHNGIQSTLNIQEIT